VMQSKDVCMRRPEKFKIERRERKKIFKKNIANKQNVQTSKRLNDTYSEIENIEFKRMSKIQQILYFSFR
jgi:hypothetical protein